MSYLSTKDQLDLVENMVSIIDGSKEITPEMATGLNKMGELLIALTNASDLSTDFDEYVGTIYDVIVNKNTADQGWIVAFRKTLDKYLVDR